MTTNVRWFRSHMTGVPQLNTNSESFIDVLDICLINGANLLVIDSMTFANGVVTASIVGGVPYHVGQVVEVTGANESDYNGEFTVESVTATSFTYEITGTPTSPATGSASARMAPIAGWSKVFTAPGEAVYRSDDVEGSRYYLKVIDDATYESGKTCVIEWYSDMSDINTGTLIRTHYLAKARFSTGDWVLIGDPRFFYFMNWAYSDTETRLFLTNFFGDLKGYKTDDAHGSVLGFTADSTAPYNHIGYYQHGVVLNLVQDYSSNYNGQWVARDITDLEEPVKIVAGTTPLGNQAPVNIGTTGLGLEGNTNPVDGINMMVKMYALTTGLYGRAIRGEYPGLGFLNTHNLGLFNPFDILEGKGDLAGNKYLLVPMQRGSSTIGAEVSPAVFLINNDWR